MFTFPVTMISNQGFSTLSLSFSGTDYVDLGFVADMNLGTSTPFTFSWWMKGGGTVIGNRGSGRGFTMVVFIGGAVASLGLTIDTGGDVTMFGGGGTAIDGAWNHCSLTYSGNGNQDGYTFRVNAGAPSVPGSVPQGEWETLSSWRLGQTTIGGGQYTGNMDEFSIYDAELSAAQITAIYNSGNPTDLTGHANLIHWWRMGEDITAFPTMPDQVASMDGTLTNMVVGDISPDVP